MRLQWCIWFYLAGESAIAVQAHLRSRRRITWWVWGRWTVSTPRELGGPLGGRTCFPFDDPFCFLLLLPDGVNLIQYSCRWSCFLNLQSVFIAHSGLFGSASCLSVWVYLVCLFLSFLLNHSKWLTVMKSAMFLCLNTVLDLAVWKCNRLQQQQQQHPHCFDFRAIKLGLFKQNMCVHEFVCVCVYISG